MNRRPLALSLLGVGAFVMVVASGWAPKQPELFNGGAACQLAPCGTLEDPSRWRAAWLLWSMGLVVAVVGVAMLSRQRLRLSWRGLIGLGLLVPVWVASVVVVAVVTSLLTSVHGVATVLALGVWLPLVALVAPMARRRRKATHALGEEINDP